MDTGLTLVVLIDIILAFIVIIFAWLSIQSKDLFTGIVYFISFGLLLALVWVRQNAPDVALAEAAIGAGLSGALLLQSLAGLPSGSRQVANRQPVYIQAFALVLCLLIGSGLAYALLQSETQGNLIKAVSENLGISGVSNPVTAVLLNFRGYDTLLELMVLLVAVLGVRSISSLQLRPISTNPALTTLSSLLTPMLILVAGYLLWAGADFPGGAFQAGSVLAAAGVLSMLSGWNPNQLLNTLLFKIILVSGPLVFILIALYTLLLNDSLLLMHNAQAGRLILLLESVATVSIALTLTVLFAANSTACTKTEQHMEKNSQ